MPSHSQTNSTSRLPSFLAKLTKKQWGIIGAVAVVIIGAVIAIVATGSGAPTAAKPPAAPAVAPSLSSNRCPLTDLPAPGGVVPQREPIAVKIGNEPDGARPQSGLNEADIVYDTPAEGFIMRYVAIYQCQGATNIGPVRSVRWVDWHILSQFTHAALAFVGGVNPNQAEVAHIPWLDDANEFVHASLFHQNTARQAPDATYTSTAAIWAMFPHHLAPHPLFTYDASLPSSATAASSIYIGFSAGTDVDWKWDPAANQYLHTYSNVPDIDQVDNQQVSTSNIIIQIVKYKIGPYVESTGGSGDIESQLIGTGKGYVFRNGKGIAVTWHRGSARSTTTYTDAAGQKVGLQPGRTWVELLPDDIASIPGHLTITP